MNDLESRLTELAAGFDGRVGLAATLLDPRGAGRPLARLNAEEAFPAASLIKVPILLAALRQIDAGTLDLGERVTTRE